MVWGSYLLFLKSIFLRLPAHVEKSCVACILFEISGHKHLTYLTLIRPRWGVGRTLGSLCFSLASLLKKYIISHMTLGNFSLVNGQPNIKKFPYEFKLWGCKQSTPSDCMLQHVKSSNFGELTLNFDL